MYFDLQYENAFPKGNYFYNTFKTIPSNFIAETSISSKIFEFLEEKRFYEIFKAESLTPGKNKKVYGKETVYQKDKMIISITPYYEADEDFNDLTSYNKSYDVCFLYDKGDEKCLEVLESLKVFCLQNIFKKTKGKKISLVVSAPHGLKTKEIKLPEVKIDIENSYGKDFCPVYEKIKNTLSKEDAKGLVLLHGKPGTGKTTLIKHLINTVNKEVIFIPSHMVDTISGPGFVPFLLEHSNSILVIEDAERVLLSRGSGESSSEGVSNILNLTDGTLDILNIQIIATFNTDRKNIDQALLRKGRLIAEWEFKALSVEDSNELLSKVHDGKGYTTDVPMILTDIYNYEEEVFKNKAENKKIGFIR